MSNILYSQVDENLQTELNLRGNSGKTRTTDDINFMVSKLANVQLTAYEDNNSDPTKIVKEHGILGGQTVRAGRYLPSSFLSKQDFVYCLKHLHESDKFSFIQSSLKVKNSIELALFYKDIRRAIWAKDWKGIARWIVGWKGYWRYLPFYDFKLSKKVVHEIWVEIGLYKLRKIKQKLGFR